MSETLGGYRVGSFSVEGWYYRDDEELPAHYNPLPMFGLRASWSPRGIVTDVSGGTITVEWRNPLRSAATPNDQLKQS